MNAPVNPALLATPAPELALITMGFGNLQQFEFMQRAANMITQSTLVPAAYRRWLPKNSKRDCTEFVENPNAIPNAMIALNMSSRMRADVLMVMQNLNIIEGKPSWSSTFVISMINTSGRFSTLRYRIEDLGEKEVTYFETKWEDGPNDRRVKKYYEKKATVRNLSCVAYCTDVATREVLESPAITMEMAVAEGWYAREGSKWQTLPELMLHYRSATFFGRLYAPELLMGLRTADELVDMGMLHQQPDGVYMPEGETGPLAEGDQRGPSTPQRPQAKPQAAATTDTQAASAAPAATPTPAPTAAPAAATQAQQEAAAAPAPSPAPAPAPAATPAAAPQASAPEDSSPACSDGMRKFLLKKFAAQPDKLLPALQAAGFHGLDGASLQRVIEIIQKCDSTHLLGLTEAQFSTAKAHA